MGIKGLIGRIAQANEKEFKGQRLSIGRLNRHSPLCGVRGHRDYLKGSKCQKAIVR